MTGDDTSIAAQTEVTQPEREMQNRQDFIGPMTSFLWTTGSSETYVKHQGSERVFFIINLSRFQIAFLQYRCNLSVWRLNTDHVYYNPRSSIDATTGFLPPGIRTGKAVHGRSTTNQIRRHKVP